MKLLVIGPQQSALAESQEGKARAALQASAVERYVVYTPKRGESKLAAARRFSRMSRTEDFDTVSAQDPFFVGLIAWRIARKRGARFNVQVHADLGAQSFMRRTLAGMVLRRADSVRVVSERIKKQVTALGVRAPIVVLPLFVDLASFAALPRRAHSQKTILWVGRFEKEKDPLLAITVCKEIPEAKLIMLGSGSLEAAVKDAAKGMRVEFPGWADPKAYLPVADLLLSTSPAESWGVAIVEALAAGVPVVSLDVGVAKEAGAQVVPQERLVEATLQTLRTGESGRLQLPVLTKEAWIETWKNSL